MSYAIKASKAKAGASPTSGAMISRRAYMGDPGLFGFLGKAVGGLAKTIGKATGLIDEPAQPQIQYIQPPQQRPGGFAVPFPGAGDLRVRPGAALPGGAPFLQREIRSNAQPGTKLACPSGYHPNKSDYFLKDGTFVAAGSKCVKNRRTNPLNPKALSRSIRRLEQGKRAAKRLDRINIKCKRCGYSKCRC